MAKKVAKVVKMELPGGEAKPGPKLASRCCYAKILYRI